MLEEGTDRGAGFVISRCLAATPQRQVADAALAAVPRPEDARTGWRRFRFPGLDPPVECGVYSLRAG